MNIRTYAGIVTGVCLILIGLLVWTFFDDGKGKAGEENESRYLSKIAGLEAGIVHRNKFIESEAEARLKDNARHLRSQDSLKQIVTRLKGRTIPTSVLASEAPNTCKHLIEQLEIRDSTITATNALSEDLQKQVTSQATSYERSLDSLQMNVQAERKKFEIAQERGDSLVNIKPPSNWGIGGTAGAGAVISNGQVHAGFGAMFGITYRIPIRPLRLFRKRR